MVKTPQAQSSLKFDMFVIGTGPAGQRAAIQAAKLGKRVGIGERRRVVGGVSINTGTIPSKTFREAVLHLTGFRQRGIYGSAFTVKEDITVDDLIFRCDFVIKREVDVIRHQMRRNRVHIVAGEASFRDAHRLEINDAGTTVEVEAEYVVIATGSRPANPPGVEVDGKTIITSDMILDLKGIPRTMTVVGGGVIGVEYASIFAALGVGVTLVEKRPRLLDFVDTEIVESLVYQMRGNDVILRLGEEVDSVHVDELHRAVANLKSGKKIVSELLLYSIGRIGSTSSLNLGEAGLSADDRGRLKVNETHQTEQPHIYAVGDVIGFPSLASTSMEQGRAAACHAFGIEYASTPELFPIGIFSVPEISMVGKTEEELTKAGVPYEVGLARYREIARGNILGDDTGLLKLLFHRETRKVLGVHIIGTDAAELVHIGQAVMAFEGTLDYFVNTVFNYPTFAECYKVAALDCYNKLGPLEGGAAHPDA
ncbi:MAG: Si-specific NAD(P)(+) transhydrogenase [Chloroflexi bacterium]|nr:Si-specific NAD(P)(+) transhydrogenase [Chloroflexota bacterium]